MKFLRLVPLALILAACSSIKAPISLYRIDVQQGNALEQESVDKLKPGLTRSQVRFLLGTPLVVDPFHANRWDYVYNHRKAGKLTEERRLVLFFDGDVLARIEADGFEPKGEMPVAKPVETAKPADNPAEKPAENTAEPVKPAVAPPAPMIVPLLPAEPSKPAQPAPVAAVGPTAEPAPVAQPQPRPQAKPAAEPAPTTQEAPAQTAPRSEPNLNETSIVPPLQSKVAKPAEESKKPTAVTDKPPESVALQPAAEVAAIKPDVMPEFMNPAAAPEERVMAALNAWANAWKSHDEEAYFAAYAASFRPPDGQSRAEWEKRRRLLLGVSRNIDVKIDSPSAEMLGEDRAVVTFMQFYRSDFYQDAVIKQLKFVRVNNLWLIEGEKILAPIKVKK